MIGKLVLATITIVLAVSAGPAADGGGVTLTGWGIDEKNLEGYLAKAEATGFDAFITGTTNPQALTRIVAAAMARNIRVYSYVSPMGNLAALWKKQYGERPFPWQVMNEEEEAAFRFIMAGNNRYIIPYQFGGEPVMTSEVLTNRIVCFNSPEARELFKRVIDGILSVPGIAGLGFDGFGYQNYHRCYCNHCEKLLTEYLKAHPQMAPKDATIAFFRDSLIDYVNYLADYARSRNATARTTIHIWPVFAPEPLYGNRLNVDECGQTAAWYTLWPEAKIAEYSRVVCGEAKKHHQRQEGVGMIGYYNRPGQFPIKDAARVDLELRTMLDNGCRSIQVCSSIDVINNEAIAEVFRKHFR
ncbi:MAG: hypothetical protein ACYC63_06600 [Armatimonadota bacterium]